MYMKLKKTTKTQSIRIYGRLNESN